jgi:hypothetical protein
MPIARVMRRGRSPVGYISPFTYFRRAAIYRGFLRGRKGWMVVGAVLWAPRLVRSALGRKEEYVTTEVLKPGQAIRLEAIPPPSRKARRAS